MFITVRNTQLGSRIVTAILLLFSVLPAKGDELDDYVQARMRELHIPGLSLAVVQGGRVVRSQGYGLANVELNVPAAEETVFEIGSVTKQFTGAAILMLVEEGRIGLDDSLSKYLSGAPNAWRPITIRHLLTHSSGIPNYLAVPDFPDIHGTGASHGEITDLFFKRLQLEFKPGETWSYSNSGYLLLGNILEKVSGQSYWTFLDHRIFKPLGMTATRSSEPREIIPNRASGYEWRSDRFENRRALAENAYAAGSIVSTVRDMARWEAALSSGKLLRKSSFDLMWTPNRTAGGALAPFNYGFGWFIDTYHGRRVIAHTGGTPGFSSAIYRFADDRLTVVLLTNHTDRVIDHLAIDIAGFYVPALARPKATKADPTSERLKQALLGLFAGKPDPALFTPEMRLFLHTATGQGLWPWAGSDGEVKSFTFSEQEDIGDVRILRYKAVLGEATRWFSFTITPDGKIAQVNWW